jgi:PilZ domain
MIRSSKVTELRQSPRFRADADIVATMVTDTELNPVLGICTDISQGGISALLPVEFDPGSLVGLEFHIPGSDTIWLNAIVRHCQGSVGMEFVSLTEQQRKLIKRYCGFLPKLKRRA